MARLLAAAVAGSEDLALAARLSLRDGWERPDGVDASADSERSATGARGAGDAPGSAGNGGHDPGRSAVEARGAGDEPGPPGAAGAQAGVVGALRDVPGVAPVVIDFTTPEGTRRLLREAGGTRCSLVIGTSGLTAADLDLLCEVARERAVLRAANFSTALVAVRAFVAALAERVGSDWGAGVVDVHFAGKRDRPSATALDLADVWRGRHGELPEIASFRMGGGVSEHRLLAAGAGELVELRHRVDDRAAFVPGVLAAARFVAEAAPGLYTLEDALCR